MIQDSDLDSFRRSDAGSDEPAAAPKTGSAPPYAGSFTFNLKSITPEISQAFKIAADAYGVDENVLIGIAARESGFNPQAVGPVTENGKRAVGLMMFMPDTANEYGIDPTDPIESVMGAAAYMRQSLDRFGGDYRKAIASYNWGRDRSEFDSPDWDKSLPKETSQYLAYVEQFIGADGEPAKGDSFGTARTEDRGFVPDVQDTSEMEAASKPYFGTSSPKSRRPQESLSPTVVGPSAPEDLPTTSKAPVDPKVRAEIYAAWDAADPGKRAMMEAAPGWAGMLARERAGVFKRFDAGKTGVVEQFDPRREARSNRLVGAGENAIFADRAAKEAAASGIDPGNEVKFIQGQYGTIGTNRSPIGQMQDELAATRPGAKPEGVVEVASNAIMRGIHQNAGMGSALLAAGAKSIGADGLALDLLRSYFLRQIDAKKYPAQIEDFTKIDSLSDVPVYVLEGVLENAPQLVGTIGSSVIGATLAKKFGAKAVADMAVEQAGKELARRQAIGAAVGAGATSIGMETGSIYGDVAKDTGQERPGVAASFGVVAGALDAIPAFRAATKILGQDTSSFVAKEIFKRYGTEAVKQLRSEGGTEFLQTWIEEAAKTYVDGRPLLTAENLIQAIDAGLKGGLAGAVTGASSQGISDFRNRALIAVDDAAKKAKSDALNKWQSFADAGKRAPQERNAEAKIADISKAETIDEVAAKALEVVNTPVASAASVTTAPDLAPTVDAITALENTNVSPSGDSGVVAAGAPASQADQSGPGVGAAGLAVPDSGGSGSVDTATADSSVPASGSVPQPGGESSPAVEPAKVWYGRRGDGYLTPEDAQRGLGERQRLQGQFDWRIEPTPDGKYRLAGYASSTATGTVQASAPAYQSVNQAPITFSQGKGGSWFVGGDPATVRDLLKTNGITNFLPTKDGAQLPASTDPEVIGAIRMMAEDIKNLSHQELKDDIRKRMGLDQPKEKSPAGSPFRSFLRNFGIKPELRADITGESNGFRANARLPKTFRADGLNIDELAQRAVEYGFMRQSELDDPNDNGGANRLIAMIQAEIRGVRQMTVEDMNESDPAEEAAQAEVMGRLDRMGVPVSVYRDMTPAQMDRLAKRIGKRLERARLNRQAIEVAEEARIEREAIIWADALPLQAQDDRLPSVITTVGNNATLEQAMRALLFTEQEIQDALAKEASAAQRAEADGPIEPEGPGRSAQAGGRDSDREGPRAEGQAEAGLTAPTPEDIIAQQERAEQGEKDEQQAKAAEQARIRKAEQDKENKTRADATVDDFQLGQSADRQMSGVRDMFDAPAAASAPTSKENPTSLSTSGGRGKETGESEQVAAPSATKDAQQAEVPALTGIRGLDQQGAASERARKAREAGTSWAVGIPGKLPEYEAPTRASAEAFITPSMRKLGFVAYPMAQEAPSEPMQEDKAEPSTKAKIDDVGEKIGGARKDTAQSTGPKRKASGNDDEQPAWARRYEVSQQVDGIGDDGNHVGPWLVRDKRDTDFMGNARKVGGPFATREEAQAFIAIAAVSRKHRIVSASVKKGDPDRYEIWRDISDRKRVKVVEQSFESRDEAKRYMVENAAEILETNTTFGEADIPLPPNKARSGPQRRTGNVTGEDFKSTFGLRGVEFGNWNNQDERQALMNDAYDGLMDLADVIGVPPKAIGLNGDLALAFGARGQGLSSARAHYESGRAVINLTKERGAGSLAHEWFHALDHYFGRQDGKASAKWTVNDDGTRELDAKGAERDMVSHGFSVNRSGVRKELRDAYDAILRTMFKKAEAYVEDMEKVDKFTGIAREQLAEKLDALRAELSSQKDSKYYKRNNKPASAEQLAEFDRIAKAMVDGDASAIVTNWMTIPTSKASIAARWSNESLERLSAIYKEVRGRSGFDSSNRNGIFDDLRGYMTRYAQRLKMLADAQSSTEKTKMVPTDFARDAKELDQGRGTDYWTTPHEMAARAFQGYMEDKIAERGDVSRFLNYGPENVGILTPWGVKRPFPAGDERKAINAAFDKFLSQIQTREDDAGNVAMFSRGPFYSSLRQSIEKINAKALPPGLWKDGIRGLLNKGAVKADEVEWSGLNEWLDLQSGKVTKDQVLAYLDANGVRVEEVTLGAKSNAEADKAMEKWGIVVARNPEDPGQVGFIDRDNPDDIMTAEELEEAAYPIGAVRAAMDIESGGVAIGAAGFPKYTQYTLPGGTNYREVLLTLPEQAYRYKGKLRDLSALTAAERERFKDMSGFAGDGNFKDAAELDEWQALFMKTKEAPEGYRSNHWDQPNVLAHIRLNDRYDEDGKRVLFVEEVQSDWGQEGKKKGFVQPMTPAKEARIKELEAEVKAISDSWGGLPALLRASKDNPDAQAARAKQTELRAEIAKIQEASGIVPSGGVKNGVAIPAAPFVTATDKWLSLALKRIMVMAAQEGYDRVAFVNGEQSADRYSLDKHVGSVTYVPGMNGGTLLATDLGDNSFVIKETNVTPEKVADFVGKDVAEKLMAQPIKDGSHKLTGSGLKVPQGGMRAFYDTIVPNTLKPLLKKVGGGQIVGMRLPGSADYKTLTRAGEATGLTQAQLDRMPFTERKALVDSRLPEQPGFDITPDMRERLVGGMPLFRAQGQTGGMSVEAARRIIDAKVAKWTNGPRVVVVATPQDLPMQAPDDANGVYHQGTVYIVAGAHRSPGQVLRTLAHEAVAHYGLRGMLGDGYKKFLAQMQMAIKMGNKPLIAIRDDVRSRYRDEDGRYNLTELQEADEIAARAIEMGLDENGEFKTGFGWLKSWFAKLAQFLRELGITIPVTNAELQGMLVNAQRFVQGRPDGTGVAVEPAPAFARDGTIEVDGVQRPRTNSEGQPIHPTDEGLRNFWRWFGDSKVVDDQGRPLVVYHGSSVAGFTEFNTKGQGKTRGTGAFFSDSYSLARGYVKGRAADARVYTPEQIFNDPSLVDGLEIETGILVEVTVSSRGRTEWQWFADEDAANEELETDPGEALVTKPGYKMIDPNGDETVGTKEEIISALKDVRNDPHPGIYSAYLKIDDMPTWDWGGRNWDDGTDGNDWVTKNEDGDIVEYFGNEEDAKFAASTAAEPLTVEQDRGMGITTDDAAREGRDMGADGIRIENVSDTGPHGYAEDGNVFVVFGPNQIKSASDNTGAFGPGDDDIRFSRGQPGLFDSGQWDVPETGRVDAIIQKFQDGRIDLKRAQDAIIESGKTIDEKFDARLAETLYAGRVAHRSENFIKGEVKELLERMARLNVPMTDLSDFLLARHAPERNKQIAKVNPDMPDGGAGSNSKGELMTTQAAKDYIAALPSETKLKMTTLAALVDKITKGTRELLVAEGLESRDSIQAWEGAYSNYVPLFKDEAQGVSHPIGQGMSVRGSASRRATGSTGEVTNMLAHVLMQREAAITRAEKNRVGLALYGLALSHPNKDFWTTIKPNMSEEAISEELEAMGVDLNEASQGMSYAPTIRDVDSKTGQVVSRPNPLYKNLPGAMVVRVNGEDRVLMFNQENERGLRLAQNLKNLDGLDIANETLQKIVGTPTRWIASVNTQYNPAFGLVNVTRDALGAMVNLSSTQIAGKQLQVAGHVPSAMAGIFQHMRGDMDGEWAKLYEQFQMDGGKTGFKEMFRTADERTKALQDAIDKVDRSKLDPREIASGLLSILDGFNTISENIVRLSAYKVALDSGLSRAESARLARELTVDFNRKGSHGTTMGMLYAFFNASVQGSARTIKAIQGPAGKSIILGGLALGAMQALMLAAAGYDDDEIPEWVKARGLVIPLGKDDQGQKKHAIIPLPLGLHVLPNTGRALTELALYGKRDMGTKIVNAVGEIAGAFNPMGGANILTDEGALKTILPTIFDPLAELATNTNFSGRKIEKDYRETDNRPGFQRAREGTIRTASGQAYISVSKAMNTLTGGTDYQRGLASPSPEQIRYVAQVVGGGLLREVEKVANMAMPTASQRDIKVTGIPLAGRFYGVADDEQTQSSRYYKNAKDIDKIESSLGAAKKAGDREAVAEMSKDPLAALVHYNNTVGARLSRLNKMAAQTVNDRARTIQIDRDRTELMRSLNNEVIRMEEKADGPNLAQRMRR